MPPGTSALKSYEEKQVLPPFPTWSGVGVCETIGLPEMTVDFRMIFFGVRLLF